MDDTTKLLKVDAKWPTTPPSIQTACWGVIKPILTSDADSSEKVARITSGLARLVDDNVDWYGFWWTFLSIADVVPADHPWQEVMIEVVASLSRLDGPVYQSESINNNEYYKWKNLPDLGSQTRDFWADPTLMPEEDGGFTTDQVSEWQNFSSFLARLGSSIKACQWSSFPIWELREDLEEPPPPPESPRLLEIVASRLWVATEWLLHEGEFIFEVMNLTRAPSEDEERLFAVGKLAEGIELYSVERWEFWKRRLLEIADGFELEQSMVERVSRTVEEMEEIEERWERKMSRKLRKKAKNQAKSRAKRRAKRHSRRK